MGEATIMLASNTDTSFQFCRKDVTSSPFFKEMLEEQEHEVIPVPFRNEVLEMAQKWFQEIWVLIKDEEDEEELDTKTRLIYNERNRTFSTSALNNGTICELTTFANKYDFSHLRKGLVAKLADLIRGSSIDHLRASFLRTSVSLDILIQGTVYEKQVPEVRVPDASGSEPKPKKIRTQ